MTSRVSNLHPGDVPPREIVLRSLLGFLRKEHPRFRHWPDERLRDFSEMGLDSIDVARLAYHLEKTFAFRFHELDDIPALTDVTVLLDTAFELLKRRSPPENKI